LKYEDPRITVIVGDATEQETYKITNEKASEGYDLIIDDGSHQSLDTISNFINYFPRLKRVACMWWRTCIVPIGRSMVEDILIIEVRLLFLNLYLIWLILSIAEVILLPVIYLRHFFKKANPRVFE